MSWPTKKKIIFQVILASIVIVVISILMKSFFVPEITKLYYLYSSILQGYAALLGIILFVLGFEYQRQKDLINDFQKDLGEKMTNFDKEFLESHGLNPTFIIFYLRRFFNDRFLPLVNEVKAFILNETKTGNPLSNSKEFEKAKMYHKELDRLEYNYRGVALVLADLRIENIRLWNLPKRTIMTLTPLMVTIIFCMILLSFTDSIISNIAICELLTGSLVILAVASLLFSIFFIVEIFEGSESRPYRYEGMWIELDLGDSMDISYPLIAWFEKMKATYKGEDSILDFMNKCEPDWETRLFNSQ